MHSGQDFVKHEFDEAIAVQQSIVRGATELARVHPMADAKRELQTAARESEQWLQRLQQAGSKFGATGEKEDVASSIEQLALTTLEKAREGEPSEVYEAQAVVINALRKQQDSAGSIVKIATSMRDRELAAEGREMQRATKKTADGLAKNLTQLAVFIATEGRETGTRGGRSSSTGRGSSGGRSSSGTRASSGTRGSSSRGAAGRTAAASRGGQKSSSSRSSSSRGGSSGSGGSSRGRSSGGNS
jgi:hypothetical protein